MRQIEPSANNKYLKPFFLLALMLISTVGNTETVKQILDKAVDIPNKSINELPPEEANTLMILEQSLNRLSGDYKNVLTNELSDLSEAERYYFQELSSKIDSREENNTIYYQHLINGISPLLDMKSSLVPEVTRIYFPIISDNKSAVITIWGDNLDRGDIMVDSNTLNFSIGTRSAKMFEIKVEPINPIQDPDLWYLKHSIALTFTSKTEDEPIESKYDAIGYAVDWHKVKGKLISYRNKRERVDAPSRIVRGLDVPRGHGAFFREIYYLSPDEWSIDIDPNNVLESWWEHDECDNSFTRHYFESLRSDYFRVKIQGKSEGGFDKDCGVNYEISVQLYKSVTTGRIDQATSPFPIEIGRNIRYIPGIFESLDIIEPNGTIQKVTESSNPFPFLKMIIWHRESRIRLLGGIDKR